MAEILEQKQLSNGNIFFRFGYTLAEVEGIADSVALFLLDQLEADPDNEIELPEWEECDNKQSVSSKMIFKVALESAGMQIVARDGSHYVILGAS